MSSQILDLSKASRLEEHLQITNDTTSGDYMELIATIKKCVEIE